VTLKNDISGSASVSTQPSGPSTGAGPTITPITLRSASGGLFDESTTADNRAENSTLFAYTIPCCESVWSYTRFDPGAYREARYVGSSDYDWTVGDFRSPVNGGLGQGLSAGMGANGGDPTDMRSTSGKWDGKNEAPQHGGHDHHRGVRPFDAGRFGLPPPVPPQLHGDRYHAPAAGAVAEFVPGDRDPRPRRRERAVGPSDGRRHVDDIDGCAEPGPPRNGDRRAASTPSTTAGWPSRTPRSVRTTPPGSWTAWRRRRRSSSSSHTQGPAITPRRASHPAATPQGFRRERLAPTSAAGGVTCNDGDADASGWVAGTGDLSVFDADGDGRYEGIDLVRVRTLEPIAWNEVGGVVVHLQAQVGASPVARCRRFRDLHPFVARFRAWVGGQPQMDGSCMNTMDSLTFPAVGDDLSHGWCNLPYDAANREPVSTPTPWSCRAVSDGMCTVTS
jgi:hypothetical protein